MTGRKSIMTVLVCVMMAFFFSMRVFNDGAPGWRNIISSDGHGYYAYLPAFLIDHDPTFSLVVEREARFFGYPHYKPEYLVKSGDHVLNKYFAGEALLLLPFFSLGALFSFITGNDINGYSFFFQIFIGIGSLFYLFLGLFFIKKILEYLHIRQAVIALTLVALLFGTNLFYYSLWQPTMSHNFSFFAVNGFLWFTIRAIHGWNFKTASRMGLFLGIICLIRPTNVMVVLLIPFLPENNIQLANFLRAMRKHKRALLLLIIIFSAIAAIQGLLWYIQTGHVVVWSYHNEGFNFSHPEVINVLFSYRKGLFIDTPLILISLLSMIPLMLKSKLRFFSMAGFLILSAWVISSWWNWYYGDGFGLRAFIDYYGVFAILLALVVNSIRLRASVIGFAFVFSPFIIMNMVQTWQYTHMVIQPNSMNATKYQYVFMRTDSAVINSLGGNEEIANYTTNLRHPVRVFVNNFEKTTENWIPNSIVETSHAFSGSHAGYLDSLHQFSPAIVIKSGQLCSMPATFYISGELMVWDSIAGASNGALVVFSIDSIGKNENYWRGFRLNDIPVNTVKTWRKITFSLMLPEITSPDRILKVYIWNTKKKPMLVDDFKVRVYGSGR